MKGGGGGGGAGRGVGREKGLVFGVSLQSNHNDPSFLPVQTNPSRCIVCSTANSHPRAL